MLRIAALFALIGGSLVVGTAHAWIFEDQAPPRPPADIPGGIFPQQPPPVHYPGPAPLPANRVDVTFQPGPKAPSATGTSQGIPKGMP